MAKKPTGKVHSTMGGKSKPVHRMHIRRGAKGGFIAEHHFKRQGEEMPEEPEEHVISDLQGLHDHMDEHMADQPDQQSAPAPAPVQAGPMPGAM